MSSTQGDPALREALAHRYVEHGIALSAQDIVLTAGGMHALNLCINILTKPGDIVLIESPTCFRFSPRSNIADCAPSKSPTRPRHGLDPDQFQYLTDRHDVRACVLMPAHQLSHRRLDAGRMRCARSSKSRDVKICRLSRTAATWICSTAKPACRR